MTLPHAKFKILVSISFDFAGVKICTKNGAQKVVSFERVEMKSEIRYSFQLGAFSRFWEIEYWKTDNKWFQKGFIFVTEYGSLSLGAALRDNFLRPKFFQNHFSNI